MIAHRSRTWAVAVLGGTVGLLWLVDPNSHRIPLCPLHAMTGLWCPLCGSTRAAHALLHADLATALHDNGLVVLALPVLAGLWWWRQAAGSTALSAVGSAVSRPVPRPVWWAGIVAGVAFGVLRNLPPGHWLAPPG